MSCGVQMVEEEDNLRSLCSSMCSQLFAFLDFEEDKDRDERRRS